MLLFSELTAVLLALALPLAAAIFLSVRVRGGWRMVLYGAMTFLLFQGLLRIPLLDLVLPNLGWYLYLANARPVLHALFLAATAALAEEGGRYLVMGLLTPTRTGAREAVAFGVGHGGTEAILLTGLNALFLLLLGRAASPAAFFAAGFERLFAMTCHVAFSVLVAAGVQKRSPLLPLAAFLLHFLLDFIIGLASAFGVGLFWIEAVTGAFALSLVPVIVVALRRENRNAPEPKPTSETDRP